MLQKNYYAYTLSAAQDGTTRASTSLTATDPVSAAVRSSEDLAESCANRLEEELALYVDGNATGSLFRFVWSS